MKILKKIENFKKNGKFRKKYLEMPIKNTRFSKHFKNLQKMFLRTKLKKIKKVKKKKIKKVKKKIKKSRKKMIL